MAKSIKVKGKPLTDSKLRKQLAVPSQTIHFYNRKVWAWETMAPNLAKRYIVHTTYSGRNMKNAKAYYEKLYGEIKLRRCAFIVIK